MSNKVKKVAAIILLIVYTSTALGVGVSIHYCQGYRSHISFLSFGGKSPCACSSDAMPKDCCKDELLSNKVDNHKVVQASYTVDTISFTPDFPPVNDLHHNQISQECGHNSDNFSPRDWRSPNPIFLLNRVFRI